MKNSPLLEVVFKCAREYIRADHKCQVGKEALSVEYVMVGLMKICDPKGFSIDWLSKKKWPMDSVNKELQLLRDFAQNRNFAWGSDQRTALREHLPEPGLSEITEFTFREAHAVAHAQNDEVTTLDWLAAVLEMPTELLKQFVFLPALDNLSAHAPESELRNCEKENEEEVPAGAPYDEKKLREMFRVAGEKRRLKEQLLQKIIGQNEAVDTFVQGIATTRFSEGMDSSERPRGIFLFAGPPGVGKTFLAESGAEAMGFPFIRFDMSEFRNGDDSISQLFGVDSSWKNSHSGVLTSFVSECNRKGTPFVMLFDEIEKAGHNVLNTFLQILDAGRATDKRTKDVVSFRNAYLIFTTNAGRSLYRDGRQPPFGIPQKLIAQAIQEDKDPLTGKHFFPQALLSRFRSGYMVMFRHLSVADLLQIGQKEMKKYADMFCQCYGTAVSIQKEIPLLLLLKMGGNCDARVFRAESQALVQRQLLQMIDAVDYQKARKALQQKNAIHFCVRRDEKKQLERIIGGQNRKSMLLVVTGNQKDTGKIIEALESCGNVLGGDCFEEAVQKLQAGEWKPSALVIQLTEKSGTAYSIPNAMLLSSGYRECAPLLKLANRFRSVFPTIVLIPEQDNNPTAANLAKEIRTLGAYEVLPYREPGRWDMGELRSLLRRSENEYILQQAVTRFARERKALTFDISPKVEKEGISIRLQNFAEQTFLSEKDEEDLKRGYSPSRQDRSVTFESYIGGEQIKEELKDVITYLKDPEEYLTTGRSAPRGLLLYGPAGTGKTYLAKALANEAGVHFEAANGSSFVGIYAGTGPQAVRELFERARRFSPAIVFIDEIDSIGQMRRGEMGARAEENTLNMLLSEMDGFDKDPERPVFVVAATNFDVEGSGLRVLDAALVSRFSRRQYIGLPDEDCRWRYLKKQVEEKHLYLVTESGLDHLARRTIGMSYRLLDNVVEKALSMNVEVTDKVLSDAVDEVRYGQKKLYSPADMERIAWHEAGHALVSTLLGQIPEVVTIVSRGDYGGYVMPAREENSFGYTKPELLQQVQICLAGRSAELLHYGQDKGLSSGPSRDLQQAGKLLTHYVCDYGMDDKLGIVYLSKPEDPPEYIRKRISELLQEHADAVMQLLQRHAKILEKFVEELLECNQMSKEQIQQFIGGENI